MVISDVLIFFRNDKNENFKMFFLKESIKLKRTKKWKFAFKNIQVGTSIPHSDHRGL